jgi:hypothetical protein
MYIQGIAVTSPVLSRESLGASKSTRGRGSRQTCQTRLARRRWAQFRPRWSAICSAHSLSVCQHQRGRVKTNRVDTNTHPPQTMHTVGRQTKYANTHLLGISEEKVGLVRVILYQNKLIWQFKIKMKQRMPILSGKGVSNSVKMNSLTVKAVYLNERTKPIHSPQVPRESSRTRA